MNEMTAAQADGNMWNGGAFEYDVDILRNFNQLFVNTVRTTGSNNSKRWLASKGHFAYTGKTTMPIDPLNEGVSHQMYSAHIYNSVENRYKGIKVKAVIDELNEKQFEAESENSSEPVTSDEEPPAESEPAESQPTEPAPEQGKAAFPIWIVLIIPAVIIACAAVLVLLKSKKK